MSDHPSRYDSEDPNAAEPFSDVPRRADIARRAGSSSVRVPSGDRSGAPSSRGSRLPRGDRESKGRSLVSAKLATTKSNVNQFFIMLTVACGFLALALGVYWISTLDDRTADEKLLEVPLYRALKEADPTLYASAHRTVKENMKSDGKPGITKLTIDLVPKLLEKFIPRASDSAIVDLARCHLDIFSALRAQGSDALRSLYAERRNQGPEAVLALCPPDATDRLMVILTGLVESGAGREPIVVSQQAREIMMRKFAENDMRKIIATFVKDVKADAANADPRLMEIDLAIAMESALLQYPRSEAAILFRGIRDLPTR